MKWKMTKEKILTPDYCLPTPVSKCALRATPAIRK